MRRLAGSTICLLCVLACGCAGDSSSAVHNDDALLEDVMTSVPRAQIVEDLRLDADVEDFSALSRLTVGKAGQILVPLYQDGELRIYQESGAQTARVGRKGRGPGEFESLVTMGFIADTVWVFDISLQRTTYVDPAGAVLRTVALPQRSLHDTTGAEQGRMMMFAPFSIDADGWMVGETRAAPASAGAGIGPRVAALLPPDQNARVLFYPASYEDERWMMEVEGFGQPVPFTMMPQVGWSADGRRIVTLHTDSTSENGGVLRLEVYEPGDHASAMSSTTTLRPTFTRSISYRGEPIPQEATDSALAEFLPEPGQPTEGPDNLPRRFQALARERMPRVYPPVLRVRHGLDDTIWLDMRAVADGKPSLVLDARGEPIGTVVVPANVTISQSDRSHVWGVERDENGLGSVVRYRVTGLK